MKNEMDQEVETQTILDYIDQQIKEADEIIAGKRKGYTLEEMIEMLEKEGL